MIRISSRTFAAILGVTFALRALGADSAELTAVPTGTEATVAGDRVNVRGQASLSGEVITQINKGEKVIVLDEIADPKAKKGAPAAWAKILLPTNTPVWIHADFIDEASKTVKPRKLNVRSGPGERFSSIGTLTKGAAVKELRRIDSWVEIEPPAGTFGFVAASFLKKAAPAEAVPVVVAETKPMETNTVTTAAVPVPASTNAPTVVSTNAPAGTNAPVVASETVAVTNAPALAVATTNAPVILGDPAALPDPVPSPVVVPAGEKPPEDLPLQPRIVIRDGWVRRTLSIQAPTAYGLENSVNGRLMNYLMSTNDSLNLRDLRGFQVTVKGEEYIDKRWPNTPIIKIHTIEFAP